MQANIMPALSALNDSVSPSAISMTVRLISRPARTAGTRENTQVAMAKAAIKVTASLTFL